MLQCEETFILKFTLDANGDLDRLKLRRVLKAQLTYEHMSAARSRFVHLLAVVGGFISLEAIWPGFLGSQVRLVVLALWGGLVFLTLCTAVGEYFCYRKLKRCLAEKNSACSDDSF